eukprot:CAMPEP_0172562662 /NCGR_PEP_ID=MMETSP1067-20121228/97880_1 /TAXON_ID=265564 ORGANISM="Thalassiosira punctigera, Strain Tpunct2005C2" /NCGR_SAMPLE_ID=MMETSP1067 /ASSEMBLY_ACC=CAM_ASM_000444 /LENGTH=33 /DNA_ID= /DNA_START= /DNA_END= /DNA_ORIENTATION=
MLNLNKGTNLLLASLSVGVPLPETLKMAISMNA